MRVFLFLLMLLWSPVAHAAPQNAAHPLTPALWVAESERSKIYLFGTIHMLPKNVDWFKPHVVKAIAESELLVMEAAVPDTAAELVPMMNRLSRLSTPQAVAQRVPEEWQPTLQATIARLKAPPLHHSKTWFIALTLANLQSAANGLDPRIGVESVLTERARLNNMSVDYLETAEQQLTNFDALTEADQQRLLVSTLENMDNSKQRIDIMVADWQHGNAAIIAERARAELEAIPMLQRMLMEDRHQRWIYWLYQRAQTTKAPIFLAVGAAHMEGKNGMVELLRKQGLKVSRVMPEAPKINRRRGKN